VFSEQELGEIVQRAAELQELAQGHARGVTRDQVERVALEVGVEPEFVRQAIEERGARTERRSGFLPAHERVVAGALDPADFDVILEHVRARRSRHRQPTQVGRTLHAQVWTGSGLATLELTSRDDRTRLRLKPFPLVETLATFYPAFLAALIGAGPLAGHGHGLAAALVAVGAAATSTLAFFGWTRRSNRAAGRLADKLERVVAEETERTARARGGESDEQRAARRAAARRLPERE
jgi:hypothetical protein